MLDLLHERRRMLWAFSASVLLHLLFAFWITWMQWQHPIPERQMQEPLDVVLLEPQKPLPKQEPEKADAISNLSLKGRSERQGDRSTRIAKSPIPMNKPEKPMAAPPKGPASPETPQQARARPDKKGLRATHKDRPARPHKTQHKQVPKEIPLASLYPSATALAQLSREFEREQRIEKLLSKEAEIPINTREVKYAPYAEQLVRALEEQWRPSKIDYSAFSENERKVLMKITIERDGSLSALHIIRPSPIPSLNESAVEAVHDASPFRPLPSSWGLDRVTFYLSFEIIEDRFVFRTM